MDKIIKIFIALLLITLSINAQQIRFKNLTINQGLSQNTVLAIAQDSQGFMWFGTKDGLNRYDGLGVKKYYSKFKDSTSLSHNRVNGLNVDFEGNLWVSTEKGLNKFNPKSNNFIRYNSGRTFNSIRHKEYIVSSTAKGIALIDLKDNSITYHYPSQLEVDEQARKAFILSYSKEEILCGTEMGLFLFNTASGKFTLINLSEGKYSVIALTLDKNFIWVITNKTRFKLSAKDLSVLSQSNDYSKHNISKGNFVRELFVDSHGSKWIATWEGLLIIDKNDESTWIKKDDGNSNLSDNAINAIYEDVQGIVWVGTSFGGVSYYDPLSNKFNIITKADGLKNAIINSFAEDKNGNIFIGSIGGGIYKFDIISKKIINSYTEPLLKSNLIRKLYFDSQNRLIVCYWSDEISVFDQNMSLVFYKNFSKINKNVTGQNNYRSVIETDDGSLWLGSNQVGVIRIFKDGTIKRYNPENYNLNAADIRNFIVEKEKLYLVSNAGLFEYNELADRFFEFEIPLANHLSDIHLVSAFFTDNDEVFIGTYGSGLIRYNLKNKSLFKYSTKDGLTNNLVYGIVEENDSLLWLSTNHGLSQFNINSESFKNYYYSDGLQSNEFNDNAYFKTSDEYLFFGGISGVNYFKPGKIKHNNFLPSVIITELQTLNSPERKGENLIFEDPIYLNYDENDVYVELRSLNFSFPENNHFKYKLDPSSPEWINLGTSKNLILSNLKPDNYVLQIKGSNNDLVWNNNFFSKEIIVIPPFYMTLWFNTLVIILIMSIIGLLIWLKVKQALDIERLRVKIASDLHDDIGASLTKLSMNADLIQYEKTEEKIAVRTKKLQSISRDVIGMMSDIVWSIDSRNDTTYDLFDRMSNHIANLRTESKIEIEFQSNVKSISKKLPLQKRQNIFLIFKESLNNAIKYSKATKISVSFYELKGRLVYSIMDDGIGFDESLIVKGNGLRNMRMRAEKINANIKFETQNGVKIKVEV